jgi:diaminopimelate epimerase
LDLKEDVEKAKEKIKQLMIKKIKTDDKAIGMMFIERVEDKLKINPVVWVKDIDTLFYETACGSGSLGTAIYNYFKTKEKSAEIIQPSGFSICIELNIEEDIIKTAKVRGVVKECELVQKKD